ncbi:GNAT family N-acetyltransferase [Anaerosacchariphilus polymeriproducens]|uniref:N-acetyltransferase n=1 Tax=Anaerosacchariphilus polymeriproducens TaxID=1812858 RepID=A0A371AYK9_9FIRM|nr:GNAT family N-acetyltransferase [Anaerosacchariphilus polymeriproducens]RDU24684.1 N-acetyltransferase [Anaerosacchariphilus polymeriproducens]
MIEFREAKFSELKNVARLITDSFKSYPLFRLLMPPDKIDEKLMYQLHYLNTKLFYKKHCCFVGIKDGNIITAALLKHRDKEINLMDYIIAGGLSLVIQGGITCMKNLLQITQKSKQACHLLSNKMWYLETLVVDGNYQGQNIGSHMLKDCIFPYIQSNGGGLFTLITNTQKNRIFYTKNGFSEFNEMFLENYNYRVGNWSFKTTI